jgi:hypothetical protein
MTQEPSLTKPTWWLLYAIGLLMLSLLALIAALVDAGTGQTILEVAVVVLVVPWMMVWVRCNRVAMELEDWRAHSRRRGPAVAPPSGTSHETLRARDDRAAMNAPVKSADRRRSAISASRSL